MFGAKADSRTARDFAQCMRDLVNLHYPKAERIRVVLDNLSTHSPAGAAEGRLIDQHRKQPLDNDGLEKPHRKAEEWSNRKLNCAPHGGCFLRKKPRESGLFGKASPLREKVRRLTGGPT